jgi:acyl-CoA thioesterase-1
MDDNLRESYYLSIMKQFFLIFFILQLFSFSSIAAEQERRILIIGDSLTEGYGVSKKDAYPNQLQLLLNQKKIKAKIVNAGSSGSTSASALSRLKWHMKVKPYLLILALGGNDGLRGIKPSSTKENLKRAIILAKEKGVVVYLAGMQMPYNYGADYRKAFSGVFKELIKEHKLKEIPFLLKDVGGKKELNQPDGIHPNEKGHKIIAQTVANIIGKEL